MTLHGKNTHSLEKKKWFESENNKKWPRRTKGNKKFGMLRLLMEYAQEMRRQEYLTRSLDLPIVIFGSDKKHQEYLTAGRLHAREGGQIKR